MCSGNSETIYGYDNAAQYSETLSIIPRETSLGRTEGSQRNASCVEEAPVFNVMPYARAAAWRKVSTEIDEDLVRAGARGDDEDAWEYHDLVPESEEELRQLTNGVVEEH